MMNPPMGNAHHGRKRTAPTLLRSDDQGRRLFWAPIVEGSPSRCLSCDMPHARYRFRRVGKREPPPKVPASLAGPFCNSMCFNRWVTP